MTDCSTFPANAVGHNYFCTAVGNGTKSNEPFFPVFVFICMRRTLLLLLLLLLQWRTVYSASTCGLSPSTVVVNQSEFDARRKHGVHPRHRNSPPVDICPSRLGFGSNY